MCEESFSSVVTVMMVVIVIAGTEFVFKPIFSRTCFIFDPTPRTRKELVVVLRLKSMIIFELKGVVISELKGIKAHDEEAYHNECKQFHT